MAKKSFKKSGDKRDGKQFVAFPHVVIDSAGYRQAGHVARSLLLDIARQYKGNNNGKLVACSSHLQQKGWRSNSTVTKALRELIACGLLIETRKGRRPNVAAWFALPWCDLDPARDFDIDASLYRRGGYSTPENIESISPGRADKATAARRAAAATKNAMRAARGNTALKPSHGVVLAGIAPRHGVTGLAIAPRHGAVMTDSAVVLPPFGGAYLETPSPPRLWTGQAFAADHSISMSTKGEFSTGGVANDTQSPTTVDPSSPQAVRLKSLAR